MPNCECGQKAWYNVKEEKVAKFCKNHRTEFMHNVYTKFCKTCNIKPATHNFKGLKVEFCCLHAEPSMINLRSKKCIKCKERFPCFNYEGKKGQFCSICSSEGMIDVFNKKCIECKGPQPRFNFEGEKPLYCTWCRKQGMRDLVSPMCIKCGLHQPIFNVAGEKALYCGSCKFDSMVNVKDKMCIKCGLHQPTFNIAGEKALYCGSCRSSQMIDVSNNKCIKCHNKHRCFNKEGEKALYCNDCKQPEHINVTEKRKCVKCNERVPSFNKKGETKPLYCSLCADESMIDLMHKKCIKCNIASPSFNFEGKKPEFCLKCCDSGMVNVVASRPTCKECGCLARHGYPQMKASHCSEHKLTSMIIDPRRHCAFKSETSTKKCKEFAIWGYGSHSVCEAHKSNDMLNFIERKCAECQHIDVISQDTNKCLSCDAFFKDKVRKAKEMEVKAFLDQNLYIYISHDRKIAYTDLLNRPDFLFESQDKAYFIVLEVDERQHKFNEENCECVRMVNISQALGKPTMFIRYNPDTYKTKDKECNVITWRRKETLSKWLDKLLKTSHEEIQLYGFCSFVQLFYDDYQPKMAQIIPILPFES